MVVSPEPDFAPEGDWSGAAGRSLPPRAACWRLRTRTLDCSRRPLLMGIVNVTPDSFSDGGRYLASEAAVVRGLELIDGGADLIDVGGESTRPYSQGVSATEQLDRVLPVVEQLAARSSVPISIDTRSAAVARAALASGAEVINDVSGLEADPEMLAVACETGAGVCAMHMQGTPETMQEAPRYHDVVAEILSYLAQRRAALVAAGIVAERICLDPGIGFGKTHVHNVTLMRNCWQFHALGQPLLVGHSRKGFLAKILGDKQADRTFATSGSAVALAEQGVHVIRIHDVRPVRETLQAWSACCAREATLTSPWGNTIVE